MMNDELRMKNCASLILNFAFLILNWLIAEAADGKSGVLGVVAPVHVRVVVAQVAVPRGVAAVLRRRPEVGAVARAVERRTAADARRNGGKARGVVRARVIAHRTIVRVSDPPLRGSQRLGDVIIDAVAGVFALAAHIVRQLSPLRNTWQMPPRRTDTPAVAAERHGHGIAVAGVHARLPVGRVERVHRRVPVIEQAVVHRRIRS